MKMLQLPENLRNAVLSCLVNSIPTRNSVNETNILLNQLRDLKLVEEPKPTGKPKRKNARIAKDKSKQN